MKNLELYILRKIGLPLVDLLRWMTIRIQKLEEE